MGVIALVLGTLAILTGNAGSIFVWVDVGLCLLLAVIFFVIGLKGCRSRPGRGAPTVGLVKTAFYVSAVIAIFGPGVKALAELGEGGQRGPIVIQPRECKAAPVEASPH
ncbi:MAG: hypothetical protein ACTHK6_03200 [Solirubrobacterales bacterium]